MEISESTLPKRNQELGGGFSLLSAKTGISRALEGSAGKVLLLSDRQHCAHVAPFSTHPRAMTVILEGDCLPLFAMPDGVSRAVAVGGAGVLQAARFFAGVRGIACELFPTDAALDGAFEAQGRLTVGGEMLTFPLAEAAVYGDMELVQPTLKGACVRLLLCRLALFEARALRLLCGKGTAEVNERAYSVCECVHKQTAAQLLIKNALLRRCEREGAPVGEGVALFRALARAGEELPEWAAFVQLSALYTAFFSKGKPRRYVIPDYGDCRAEIASTEQYCARALALERFRAGLLRELQAVSAEGERFRRALSLPKSCGNHLQSLRQLPQTAHGGLSALMRDFGLMEWQL